MTWWGDWFGEYNGNWFGDEPELEPSSASSGGSGYIDPLPAPYDWRKDHQQITMLMGYWYVR
jgi:hypothetical protein